MIDLLKDIVNRGSKGAPIYNPTEESEPQVQEWKQWSAGTLLIQSVVNRFAGSDRTEKRLKEEAKLKAEATAENLEP